ncbi:MAG: hypothetical protein KBT69_03045 [Oceanihabitans sp.]|jgi:hypothetical protein|nr:hypothetical protein [Oceanihabitans sp.]
MKKLIYSAILVFTMSAVFTSCREDKKDKVEDAVEDVTDDIGDGLEDVGDEIEDVVE